MEQDSIWCPGVVYSKQGGESGAPVSPEAEAEAGLVVDVMGQAQAEFAVTENNLTDFPGFGENLETVRRAVEKGLVRVFLHVFFLLLFVVLLFGIESRKDGTFTLPFFFHSPFPHFLKRDF